MLRCFCCLQGHAKVVLQDGLQICPLILDLGAVYRCECLHQVPPKLMFSSIVFPVFLHCFSFCFPFFFPFSLLLLFPPFFPFFFVFFCYESQPVGLAEVIDASEASLGGPGGRRSHMSKNRVK